MNTLHGQLLIESFPSRCLEGNLLGDRAEREIPVYLPEGHEAAGEHVIYWNAAAAATGIHFARAETK